MDIGRAHVYTLVPGSELLQRLDTHGLQLFER